MYAAAYYTLATLCLDPKETVKKLTAIAEESFKEAIEFMDIREKAYIEKTGVKPARNAFQPCVKTFDQLYKEAKAAYDGDFDQAIKDLIKEEMKPGVEMQDTRSVTMGRRARNSGAMIMASFAPAAVSLWPPEPPMM